MPRLGTDTGYTGTIEFSDGIGTDMLPSNYTFVASDNGVHTFTNAVTLDTAGNADPLTATDTSNSAITGNTILSVTGSATAKLVLAPSRSVTAGVPFGFEVVAQDIFGNISKSYAGTVIFSQSDAAGTIPGNYTFNPSVDQGIHVFTNQTTLVTAGIDTVTATDTHTTTITGNTTFTVNPAATAKLAVATSVGTGTVTAGTSFTVTVAAEDAYGNITSTYQDHVQFSASTSVAGLPTTYPFVGSDTGVHTFTNVSVDAAGPQTLTATDNANSSITGNTTVSVTPAAAASFTVTAPTAAPPAARSP